MRHPARKSFAVIALAFACLLPASAQQTLAEQTPAKRPNIIVMVVDDAAFMDFGVYGGEARTPNIDKLAASGAMMTNYHTSPLCSPSRAMLLTGMDSHRTGLSTIEEVLPPELKGKPGYTLRLEPGVLTLADRLKATGYRTLMSGKWHLGRGEGDLPNSHGFDRSLALDASGADNWADKSYMPYYQEAPWFEDGKPAKLPDEFYSSEMLVDRLIQYIDEDKGGAPYFGYLAFQAVHIPVQAPKHFSDNYIGQFDKGWEAVRRARWDRAVASGIVPADAPFAGMPEGMRAWSAVPEDDRKKYARTMEVYSGMLEAMDHHIGRLMEHLAARGDLDNTVLVITSDNGPEPSDPVHENWMDIWMAMNGYHWNLEGMGERGSLAFIGPEWASSISGPGQFYKFYASDGGLRAPMVISAPGIQGGKRHSAFAFVTDIAPTLLEMAGAGTATPEGALPITGRSLIPLLTGQAERVYGETDAVGVEVSGNSALFRDNWKIVRNMPPVGDGNWRLYDHARDPGETNDISATMPDVFKSMLADYAAYETRSGVLPLPEGYEVERQVRRNVIARQVAFHAGAVIAIGVGVVVAIALIAFALLRRRKRRAA